MESGVKDEQKYWPCFLYSLQNSLMILIDDFFVIIWRFLYFNVQNIYTYNYFGSGKGVGVANRTPNGSKKLVPRNPSWESKSYKNSDSTSPLWSHGCKTYAILKTKYILNDMIASANKLKLYFKSTS